MPALNSYALSMSLSARQPRLLSNSFRPESPRTKKQMASMMSSYRQAMRNYSNSVKLLLRPSVRSHAILFGANFPAEL